MAADVPYLVAGDQDRVVDHGAVPQVGGVAQGVRPVGTEGPEAGGAAGGHGRTGGSRVGRVRTSRAGEGTERAVSCVQAPGAQPGRWGTRPAALPARLRGSPPLQGRGTGRPEVRT